MTAPGPVQRFLPYCGLPCPPAHLTFEGDRIASVEGACGVCREELAAPRLTEARVAGKEATLEAALDRAADLLAASRRPFVHGLAASPVQTARLAARLATRLDAALDVEGAELLEPELAAIAATGQVTATFGEMRATADLVVLWRVDPRASHPDFLPGTFEGGARRFVVVSPPADGDLPALQSLRGLLTGRLQRAPREDLGEAADAIRSARRVAILWDASIASGRVDGAAIAAGFALLTLDAPTALPDPGGGPSHAARGPWIAARAIGVRGHVAGAMAGLLSATGYPSAIGFSAGKPRRDPDRFGARRMVDAGGADLVIAIEPLRPERLSSRPAIVIGSHLPGGKAPDVFIPVTPAALRSDGLWLRADGVPLRGSAAAGPTPAVPSEAEILEALLDRLRAAA